MPIGFRIKQNYFQDALRLMRISKSVREIEGVKNAVAVMATEKAKFAVQDAGLMTPEIWDAKGADLVIVVESDSVDIAAAALARMEEMVSAGSPQGVREAPDILNQEIQAVNIGLQTFADALVAQGAAAVHLDWQIPAGGDEKLIRILKAVS
ncbi:MAG: hypothetical protein ACT4NX_10555 [Deltaproteobacteria bacterium]